jgi:3-methyladenine DNA glycosylase/8-oxoguanine DNA glycosylase
VAATRAIVGRLEALQDGRLPTPAELLATDGGALRWIGLSRAKPRTSAISRSASSTAGSTWTGYRIATTKPPGQS